jgi:serine/threonine protein kinase
MSDTERYVVESSPVGQGGFGKVHPGQDTVLERKIAVKRLDPVLVVASEEDKRRFRREATTLTKMSHPNIPAIYDAVFKDRPGALAPGPST